MKPFSLQKTPPVRPAPDVLPAPSDSDGEQDLKDEQEVSEREIARKASDKIGAVPDIDFAPFARDASPSQVFGMSVIDFYKGDVSKIPAYRFSRWYFGLKIVVDTFRSQSEYNAADVEGRRALCDLFDVKYAALGPNHSRFPYQDEAQRRRYPSMVEQLGLR